MDKEEALRELIKNRDESYKAFNDVIANCPDIPTLGVRVPKVRAVAARAGREDPDTYFASVEVCRESMYLEEHMLWGMAMATQKIGRLPGTRSGWTATCPESLPGETATAAPPP